MDRGPRLEGKTRSNSGSKTGSTLDILKSNKKIPKGISGYQAVKDEEPLKCKDGMERKK